MAKNYKTIAWMVDKKQNKHQNQATLKHLIAHYGNAPLEKADVVVVVGGDGMMLHSLHKMMDMAKITKQKNPPALFGMNLGSVGFLMNPFDEGDLHARLAQAHQTNLHPLKLLAKNKAGKLYEALAINEISLFRQTAQAARLKILIDNQTRLEELICDGILVSTPAGSTAYNLSAHGPIIPIDANLLALTPISAFRPRHWKGALLPQAANIKIEAMDNKKRPVCAVADHLEFRDAVEISVSYDTSHCLKLLFDANHNFDERILAEQFLS